MNYVDVTGLWAAGIAARSLAPLAKGAWESAKIAVPALWGSAAIADKAKELNTEEPSHAARQALVDVAPEVAGAVAGGMLAAPTFAAAIEGLPATMALLGRAGAAVGGGAGQAYVRGENALARGGKAIKGLYERNGAKMLDGVKWGQDFASGYGMPLSQPTTWPEHAGTAFGLLEYHKPSIDREIDRARRTWDEAKHPRNPQSGEFTHK